MLPPSETFFPVPHSIFRQGIFRVLSGSAQAVYIALMFEVERRSKRELFLLDDRITELCGVSSRTLRNVRLDLEKYNLYSAKRTTGGRYKYALLDPSTGRPWEVLPRHLQRPREPVVPEGDAERVVHGAEGLPLDFKRD
jgi:hypothetical protein